jgi:two-component system chemotaxis response regulator CheB
LKDTGAYTIGQDKETCVVYGMPMEAYKIGGISRQLPLDQIGSEVIYQINKTNK